MLSSAWNKTTSYVLDSLGAGTVVFASARTAPGGVSQDAGTSGWKMLDHCDAPHKPSSRVPMRQDRSHPSMEAAERISIEGQRRRQDLLKHQAAPAP